MFLENGPIDTSGYMILGFSVILGVLALHIASLSMRFRSLKQDLELLEEIDKKK